MSSRFWLNTAAMILIVTAGAVRAEDAASKPASAVKPILGVDRSYMDPSVSPCKDLYDYANGAFDKVPIPGEYAAYGVNQEIDERNFAILKEILEDSARAGGPKGSVVQRVGDFYASGMDEAAIEREGLQPLTSWFCHIQAIASPKELAAVIALLQTHGMNVGFHFDVQIDDKNATAMIAGFSQGGLGLPERDYYFREARIRRRSAPPTWPHRQDARAGRRRARTGQGRGRFHHGLGNQAGESLADAGRSAQSREELQQVQAERAAEAGPRRRLGRLFRRDCVSSANETNVLVRQPEFLTAVSGLLASEPMASGGIICDGICSPKPPTISASLLWTSISPFTASDFPGRPNCGRAGSACWRRKTPPSDRIWANCL